MTSFSASQVGTRTMSTSIDIMLLAAAAALDGIVLARRRRRAGGRQMRAYHREVAEAQRDRTGAFATRLLPR